MTHDAHGEAPAKAAQRSPSPRETEHGRHGRAYVRLAIMAVLSFAAMYVLMYAMVDRFAHVHPNLNQAYMAALMAAPMVGIELR